MNRRQIRTSKASAPVIAIVFAAMAMMMATAGCDARANLARKRSKAVDKGLMRAVYLQGLKPETLRLEGRMAFYKVPGVSLAAFDKGGLEWTRAVGRRDPQVEALLTEGTMFQAGGLTQLVTAALALRLVEEGRLGLDEDVRPRLRSWRFPAEFEPGPGGISLRALLSHSAGLSDQVLAGYGPDELRPGLPQVLAGDKPAKNGPLWVTPRRSARLEAWPSEAGYVVVQVLLEDLTGQAFPLLAAEDLPAARPCPDMLRFGLVRRPPSVGGRRLPARRQGGAGRLGPDSGGCGQRPLDDSFGIRRRRARPSGGGRRAPGQDSRAGYGPHASPGSGGEFRVWVFRRGPGEALHFRAAGATRGFACAMVIYPGAGQGAVIMTNSDNGDVLIEEILAGFSGAYGWPDFKPVEKPVLRLAPESYAEFAGRFEVDAGYALDIRSEDYYLVITPTGQAATRFYAEGQTLFYSTDPYIRIQFYRNARGEVASLVLWQKDFRLEARKVA